MFGTTQTWAIEVMNAGGYALGGLLAVKWIVRWGTGFSPVRWDRTGGRKRMAGRWLVRGMAALTVLFLAYVLLSAANARALFLWDSRVFTYFDSLPWLPHSYDRAATLFAFWQCLGLACVFWATRDWLLGMSSEERHALWDRAGRYASVVSPAAFDPSLTGATSHQSRPLPMNLSTPGRPLTPALSPSEGEREDHRQSLAFPLSPAEGERAGVRGRDSDAVLMRPSSSSGALSDRLKRLLLLVCLTGALVASEGMVQRAADSDKLLFMVQPRFNQSAKGQFGPYANKNNAAEYFNLLWPVCAGFALLSAQAVRRARREGAREPGQSHFWLTTGAILMGACPLISGSRGGTIIAVIMTPLVLAVLLAALRARHLGEKVGLGLLFAAAVQLAIIFSWDYLQERFATVFTDDLSGRPVVYKNAAAMAKDSEMFGCGAGTFESLYHLYRSDTDQEWAAYLHDDWLELRLTLGWTGFGMVLALLGGVVLYRFVGRGLALPSVLTLTFWIAMSGCLLHARFDFPFGVHSIVTLFLLYCSILSASGRR